MVIKALLVSLITALGYSDDFFGCSMLHRPIVLAPLVGLVLGDFQSGIIIGATLELVWMGIVSIGAAIPPDIITGSVLGTTFAILSGNGPEIALALAVPIAMLAQLLKSAIYIIRSGLLHKADKYADDGDIKGIERIHIGAYLMIVIPMALISFLAVLLGAGAMEMAINVVPQVIIDGLVVTSGLLPALGFALLARLMISKKLAPYFFLGFVLAVYLKLPIIGVAMVGIIIGLVMMQFNNNNDNRNEVTAHE